MSAAQPIRPKVLAHVLIFDSKPHALRCLESVLAQSGYRPGSNLELRVTDNHSMNDLAEKIQSAFPAHVTVERLDKNHGFCGAHNRCAKLFLMSDAEYLLVLNPDVKLSPNCLCALVDALERYPQAGSASPLLLRCDENLEPLHPAVVDAAGMYMTPALRHFDRGSGEALADEFNRTAFVFGGTGACLLLRRRFVEDALLCLPDIEADAASAPLFDQAFFAYREDADLAWRAQLLGWKCVYVPSAIAYHERRVTPQNRSTLPPTLNRFSVRNRFLMQVNNFMGSLGMRVVLEGLLLRNLLVLGGVLVREISSLPALGEFLVLLPRAVRRRRELVRRLQASGRWGQRGELRKWFSSRPYVEFVES